MPFKFRRSSKSDKGKNLVESDDDSTDAGENDNPGFVAMATSNVSTDGAPLGSMYAPGATGILRTRSNTTPRKNDSGYGGYKPPVTPKGSGSTPKSLLRTGSFSARKVGNNSITLGLARTPSKLSVAPNTPRGNNLRDMVSSIQGAYAPQRTRSDIEAAAYAAKLGGSTVRSIDNEESTEDGPVYVYNKDGQRAPYYDGPYLVSRNPDGSKIKRRWYGRLEDGYTAWVSIRLYEIFGISVYQPCNPLELKKGKVPEWMHKFYSLPNLAIPLSYFCIGVALQLLRTPLTLYFAKDLNATDQQLNVLYTAMAIPWSFKIIYGFLSDCVPISGLRRKPYFTIGWLIYILSNAILGTMSQPSISTCTLMIFIQTSAYIMSDVMMDAIVVERSRYESEETRGTMLSQGYIMRFFGSVVGASIGAVVYNKETWQWYLPINTVFLINATFPLIVLLPVVPFLMEFEQDCGEKDALQQCYQLYEAISLRSAWQPMIFILVYNMFQLNNAAWTNFLTDGLNFTDWSLEVVCIAGGVMAWIGIVTYKRYFFETNWRKVIFLSSVGCSVGMIGQLILVFRLNEKIGISDMSFAAGNAMILEFMLAVAFLPMCIMYLGLCPIGSEATTYALLTTWSNVSSTFAYRISTAATSVWDVSSNTIQSGTYDGLWKLSVMSALVGLIPLVLMILIPKNTEEQRRLQEDTSSSSLAGGLLIFVVIISLLIVYSDSIFAVFLDGESDNYENMAGLTRLIMGFS